MARKYRKDARYDEAGSRRKIPCVSYEDMTKHANLPTDVMMEDYPSFPSVPQRLDDSINYIDRQVHAGIKGVTKQILDKAY